MHLCYLQRRAQISGSWMMEGTSSLSGALLLTVSCYKLMGKHQSVPVLFQTGLYLVLPTSLLPLNVQGSRLASHTDAIKFFRATDALKCPLNPRFGRLNTSLQNAIRFLREGWVRVLMEVSLHREMPSTVPLVSLYCSDTAQYPNSESFHLICEEREKKNTIVFREVLWMKRVSSASLATPE